MWRIGRSTFVARWTIQVLDRMLQFGLRAVFAGAERRFTVALPIATTAAATPPTPAPSFTSFALARCAAFLVRL